jgi:sugar lactone lactonase YvrE
VDPSGTITTVAGNGTEGNSDNITATNAELRHPAGVAVDGAGNLYIADSYNHLIRKVDARTHIITTVAGKYTCCGSYGLPIVGYSGDGGPATSAQFSRLGGVAVDSAGNLYVSDFDNNLLRKVDASTGVITTVAGKYTCCDSYGNPIGGYSGDGGSATSAQLRWPSGVAVDGAGNLYIADYGNNLIRKVDTSGNITSRVQFNLNRPSGVAVDGAGNLYIADYGNNLIRKVDTSGNMTTVAGIGIAGYSGDGAAATSAKLNGPNGVTLDSAGNLYIADENSNRIRKVDVSKSALSFGSLNVGQTGSPQSVAASNLGNTSLNFGGFPLSNNFETQSVGNDCAAGGSLAVGATCNLGVAFSPTPTAAAGSLTGALTVNDDAFNTPQTVALNGTAIVGNTPVGSKVAVQPVDSTTGLSTVALMFSSVTQAGNTTLTTSSTGPVGPQGLSLGSHPMFYNIATTAVFTGTIQVCVAYTGVNFTNPSQLHLFHYQGGNWVDVTTYLNTSTNTICGNVTSLSPFAIVGRQARRRPSRVTERR